MFIPAVPITGVAGFRVLERTEENQRKALEADPQIKRDLEHFRQNIASVTTADELLADRRLLEVALTAYGLEDEIGKTAFIKRVLDEGTEQEGAFANRLNDARWQSFAEGFGFANQNSGREETDFQIAIELRMRPAPTPEPPVSAEDLAYLRETIGTLTSVEELTSNTRLLDAALGVFGLEREYQTAAWFDDLLNSGVDDADDLANRQTDPKWAEFTEALAPLLTGGGDPINGLRFSAEQNITRFGYGSRTDAEIAASVEDGETPAPEISVEDLEHFRANIDAVASGADLTADAQLLETTLLAFGLDPDEHTAAQVENYLDGGLEALSGDEESGLRAMVAAFTDDKAYNTVDLAFEKAIISNAVEPVAPTPAPDVSDEDLDYFRGVASSLTKASDLLDDPRALEVALTAFGLDQEFKSDDFIQDVLQSDLSDGNSFANVLSDTRWRDFAAAFNASSDDASVISARFQFAVEKQIEASGFEISDDDLAYLRKNFSLIDENIALAADPRLLDITMQAFGFDQGEFTSTYALRVMIADPHAPTSFLNQQTDARWGPFAQVFGMAAVTPGNTGLESFRDTVEELFKARSFEIGVGQIDEDLRLALNFRRSIQTIVNSDTIAEQSWFAIMGDLPVREVVASALNLPSESSQLPLDRQFNLFQDRAQRLFGSDEPTVFLDPDNVDRAITQFLTRAQINSNANSGSAFAALSLVTTAANNARSFNQIA